MKNSNNENIFNLDDLKKNLIKFKINLRSFFILTNKFEVFKVTGLAYVSAFRNISKTNRNLNKILKNYDLNDEEKTLNFLKKEINNLKATKEKKEKELLNEAYLSIELFCLDVEIKHYESLIYIFRENLNRKDNFECSFYYVESFIENIYTPEAKASVMFFMKTINDFKNIIINMEQNQKLQNISEKVNFIYLQGSLVDNIFELRKISHNSNKQYAKEFLEIAKTELNILASKEALNDFYVLKKMYYMNILENLEKNKIVYGLKLGEIPEYINQYFNNLNISKNLYMIIEELNENISDLFDLKHNSAIFKENLQSIFAIKEEENNFISDDTCFYDKLLLNFNMNNKELIDILCNLENKSKKNVDLFLEQEKKFLIDLLEETKENNNCSLLEIEINHYENIQKALLEKKKISENFENVIVFKNNKKLLELLEKLRLMQNTKNFKKNLSVFNSVMFSFMEQKISFSDLNSILEENIKYLNTIEKTKDIEEFLNFIASKNEKDFEIITSKGLPLLNVLLLDFIREHHKLISENFKNKKEKYFHMKTDHMYLFLMQYSDIKNKL